MSDPQDNLNSHSSHLIQRAEANLQRELDWVGRCDARIAFVAGISIAMLGVLANSSANIIDWDLFLYIVFGVTGFLLIGSLVSLYFAQYPKTDSFNSSLIYFGTIAERRLDQFQKEFKSLSDENYLDDLLCQTHTNAQILEKKFRLLKISLSMIIISVAPWLMAIYYSKLYF